MATSVSHAMRRFPGTPPEQKYNGLSPLRSEESITEPQRGPSSREESPGGSALSRSMRYAEPWLYGSVRAAPGALVLAYPAPAIVLCSCADYTTGTAKTSKKRPVQCKKCKGTRLPLPQGGTLRAQKYGTVRGYPTSAPAPTLTPVRPGTVRVSSSSRPSILPPVDPYDLMRRSRLSTPDPATNHFRARSSSPRRSRGLTPTRARSPSPPKAMLGRRSILECDVNPYELMSKFEEKEKSVQSINGQRVRVANIPEPDYEDVDVKKPSQIPKLLPQQPKNKNKRFEERESAKFKSILKKPSATFGDTDTSQAVETPVKSSSKSGSHFYLPMPTANRKKVQFLVQTELQSEEAPAVTPGVRNEEGAAEEAPDELPPMEGESPQQENDEDQEDEPCRLKRSFSERLNHGNLSVTFHDTMALRSRTRTSLADSSSLFGSATDLQRLDGIGPTKSRPKEPPPPPPPPPTTPPSTPASTPPSTPPPQSPKSDERNANEVFHKETINYGHDCAADKNTNEENEIKANSSGKIRVSFKESEQYANGTKDEQKEDKPTVNGTAEEIAQPLPPPRKRSNSKHPVDKTDKNKHISYEKTKFPFQNNDPKIENSKSSNNDNNKSLKLKLVKNDEVTVSNNSHNNNNNNIKKTEPTKTIVQINSPNVQVIPSTVHRLQIRNEFPDNGSYHSVSVTDNPQRKTSIMINGDDCYSTVNVNDDVPIYQSSVVVNDSDNKIEITSGTRSSSVYITGDFQTPNSDKKEEKRKKKTLVIFENPSPVPSTPSSGNSTPDGKTLVVLQNEQVKPELDKVTEKKNEINNKHYEDAKPSDEELQKILKDPVEAVKRNLVPHVCGKADVERKPRQTSNKKSFSSNTLVARLLEDPFLGSLAEGLETDTVAKLIEDSLMKLRNQDGAQDDDKESEIDSCPPYEMMEAGSDCYSNHSNRSSVTEDELGTRSKFYQLLADSALTEVDEHHYESIRANPDPIYEEIEIPPPLPSNPPPTTVVDDLQIDKQFTTRSIFEGASKYDILSYLVDAKERGIVPEESYTYNFNNSGEVIVEEEEENNKNEGVFSSRVSHMSTISDSSEDSSLIITGDKNGPQKSAEVERNDSGVGSETSKCSRSRYLAQPEASTACEDCDLVVDPQPEDGPLICRKCSKKRSERKEIITEIVETEEKYSRDLQIILEEFYQPMLVAGLLTPDQLSAIFLNVEELLENSQALAERLRDTLEIAVEQGDEDLLTVNIGKIFLEAAPMLHAFESYCVRQGAASLLLAGLEKEKELLRIFLRVSQMENTVLRRMNLNSFLMVPVQRVTKYPLLLNRLHKVTPLHHDSRELLRESQHKIELHLNHMNSETRDVPSKLWRRISSGAGRRSSSEMDLVNIKLRKIAVDVLEWNHDEARFALEGRLLYTQPTDNNWRKGRTIKLSPVNAMLVTNGKPGATGRPPTTTDEGELTFPRQNGIREAALLLVRDKGGRYSLLREPLYLDRCVIATDPAWQSYFEVQELLSKDTFIFKAEDNEMTKTWYRQLQYHAQGMGAWRKRRNALANIMINGMGSRT